MERRVELTSSASSSLSSSRSSNHHYSIQRNSAKVLPAPDHTPQPTALGNGKGLSPSAGILFMSSTGASPPLGASSRLPPAYRLSSQAGSSIQTASSASLSPSSSSSSPATPSQQSPLSPAGLVGATMVGGLAMEALERSTRAGPGASKNPHTAVQKRIPLTRSISASKIRAHDLSASSANLPLPAHVGGALSATRTGLAWSKKGPVGPASQLSMDEVVQMELRKEISVREKRLQQKSCRQGVFGCTLEEVLKAEALRGISPSSTGVPAVLMVLMQAITDLGGLECEGIFRIPGKQTDEEDLNNQLNEGCYTISKGTDPHVAASVLKMWLMSLSEPLIPPRWHPQCKKLKTAQEARALVAELPAVNRAVIEALLEFIWVKLLRPHVVERTKMNAENLATIFGPCILSFNHAHSDVSKMNVQELLAEMKLQKDFALMLLNYEEYKYQTRLTAPPPAPPAPPPAPTLRSPMSREGGTEAADEDGEEIRRRPRNQNQVSSGERALWLSENARELSRQRWISKERDEREGVSTSSASTNTATSPTSCPQPPAGRGVVFAGAVEETLRKRKEQEEERRMKTKNFVVKPSLNNS